jgi:hypothetical protein
MSELPKCRCGRFINPTKTRPLGWFRHGEFGEDDGWICPRCVATWEPKDGGGRGPEAGYCGVLGQTTTTPIGG